MVSKFKDVFHGLGLINSNAVIHTDPNIVPVVDPPRRIPFAIQNEVKKEIDRMLEIGVIKVQNEPTDWVNSITIVRKPNKL